jgi:hypothetical protein
MKRSDARQAPPEHVVARDGGGGDVSGNREWEVDDTAPLRAIPVVVHVPLRIERAADAHGGAGIAVIGEVNTGGKRASMWSDRACPPNGADPQLRARSAGRGGASAAEELAEVVRESL